MTKKENVPQNDVLYLDIDNFLEAKKQLKDMGIDCTDRKLSQVLNLRNIRTVQKYRSEKNQIPIPRLRLEKLAQYMDVSPEWLCGLESSPLGSVGYSEILELQNRLNRFDTRQILGNYLQSAGIKSNMSNYPAGIEEEDNGPFTEISGVPVDYDQYSKYLDEIEAAIEYITGRFILSLGK